jgi:hypothetical protein
MPIKIIEITKSDSSNAVGNMIFIYNIVDEKGVSITKEPLVSTISVNYDNAGIKDIAKSFLRDAEYQEYEVKQKTKVDQFSVAELKIEIEKQMSVKAVTL